MEEPTSRVRRFTMDDIVNYAKENLSLDKSVYIQNMLYLFLSKDGTPEERDKVNSITTYILNRDKPAAARNEPHFDKVNAVEEDQEIQDSLKNETQGACTPVQNCFKQMNDFIKEKVEAVVQKYYQGVAANLALIEITLFDHNLLKKRNAHTNLLRTLCAWGTIDPLSEEEMKKVMSGMANKMHALPAEGYLEWKGSDYVNDKKTCQDIGEDLGGTIKYFRKKEPKHG